MASNVGLGCTGASLRGVAQLDGGTAAFDAGATDGGSGHPDSGSPPDAGVGPDAGPAVDAGGACPISALPGTPFGPDAILTDPAGACFAPAVAALTGEALVVWHDASSSGTRIAYALISSGCVGPIQALPETLSNPKLPQVAATTSGFTVVYQATDGAASVVRRVDLASDGSVLTAPRTISTPGTSGEMPHVAASGDDLLFAWTSGSAFYFATSGPSEAVAATPVGNTVQDPVLTVFPRLALAPDGTSFVGYCDGPPGGEQNWDAELLARSRGGSFGGPIDLSNSPGLFDDQLALAMEPGGTLDVVWVAQSPIDVTTADVVYATRAMDGTLTAPNPFGIQGSMAWFPAVAPGLLTTWYLGNGPGGQLYFSGGAIAPAAIVPGTVAAAPAIALGPDGAVHLVFHDTQSPQQIHYAWHR